MFPYRNVYLIISEHGTVAVTSPIKGLLAFTTEIPHLHMLPVTVGEFSHRALGEETKMASILIKIWLSGAPFLSEDISFSFYS